MPESSNETEVDSVLLAIRRLIQEGRPEGQGAAMGRLVLTPALRVDAPAEPLVPMAPAPATQGGLDLFLAASDTLILINAMAPPAPASLGPSDPVEAELSGDPGALDAGVLGLASHAAAPDAADPSPAHAPLGLSNPEVAELSVDPGALEASLEVAPEAPRLASTPSDAVVSDAPGPIDADLSGLVEPAPAPLLAPMPLAPLVLTQPSDIVPIADLGPASGDPDPQAPAGRLPDPADTVSTDPTSASDPILVGNQDALDGVPPAPSAPAAVPDEAVLRALVAEVLREELRGELGERLTRNLRKLVRREVMQALSLREG